MVGKLVRINFKTSGSHVGEFAFPDHMVGFGKVKRPVVKLTRGKESQIFGDG